MMKNAEPVAGRAGSKPGVGRRPSGARAVGKGRRRSADGGALLMG